MRADGDAVVDLPNFSQVEKTKIHVVYLAYFDLPFNLQRKTMLLTALMGGVEWSWRVVGITVGALEAIAPTGYRYAKGTICRAHLIPRIDTARQLFEIPQPLPIDEFFEWFWENDETVIATKSENKTGGVLPSILPIE